MIAAIVNLIFIVICFVLSAPETKGMYWFVAMACSYNVAVGIALFIENMVRGASSSVELRKPYLLFVPGGGMLLIFDIGFMRSALAILVWSAPMFLIMKLFGE